MAEFLAAIALCKFIHGSAKTGTLHRLVAYKLRKLMSYFISEIVVPLYFLHLTMIGKIMGCLRDPANVQQTSSKCIQNTRANAGRLLDRVNTLQSLSFR